MPRWIQINFPQNTQEYLKDYSHFIDEANREFTISVVLHTPFLLKLLIYSFCLYYFLIIRCLKSHLAKDRKCISNCFRSSWANIFFVTLCFTHSKYNKDASNARIHYLILLYQCHRFCCFSDLSRCDKHWCNFSCCCLILFFCFSLKLKLKILAGYWYLGLILSHSLTSTAYCLFAVLCLNLTSWQQQISHYNVVSQPANPWFCYNAHHSSLHLQHKRCPYSFPCLSN